RPMTRDLQQQLIRQYLLGAPLDASLQRSLEERLLTEDDYCEEIDIAEDELIEQYISNELSANERASFEQAFLNTVERRQKFSVARTLNRYAETKAEAHPSRAGKDGVELSTTGARDAEDDAA